MDHAYDAVPIAFPPLLRAARAALNWSYVETSRRAQVSVVTVLASEGRTGKPLPRAAVDALQRAYEDAGIIFQIGEGRLCIDLGAR